MITPVKELILHSWSVARSHPGKEIDQALLRVIIGSSILVYLFAAYFIGVTEFKLGLTVLIAILFELFSLSIIVHLLRDPTPDTVRRYLSMAVDITAICLSMYLAGPYGAVLFPFLIWITFGYGFRYGRQYLLVCAGLCLAGFLIVVNTIDVAWSQSSVLAGIIIALVLLPAYAYKLIQQLHGAVRDAETANESKSRFIANVSHEVRTPLNAIIGANQELKETRLDPDQRDLIDDIHIASNSLYSLVDSVLDFSKIEAKQLTLDTADLDIDHLIISSVRMFRTMAAEKGLSLNVHVSPRAPYALVGDALRLRQILVNLIGNAIKFTPSGSIDLSMECLKEDDKFALLRFEITDTGVGIPEDALVNIFESYKQADESVTRRFGGTGLGTTISKQLVELMGGKIGIDSVVDQGTTFWFEIPLAKQVSMVPVLLDETRALILTDSTGVPAYLLDYLSSWHVQSEVMHDARDALRAISTSNKNRFDALILTRSHLDIDIRTFVRAARDRGLKPENPVILIDNPVDQDTEARLIKEGVSCIIHRPAEKPELFNALHCAAFDHITEHDSVIRLHGGAETSGTGGRRILVADDSPLNLKVLRRLLEKAGHTVDSVSDGESALEKLATHHYDIAFLDLNMPDISGIDIAKDFRMFNPERRTIPIVILTADATPDAKRACEEADIDRYLTKPIDSRRLLNTIEELTSVDTPVTDEVGKALAAEQVLDLEALAQLENINNTEGFAAEVIQGFLAAGDRQMNDIGRRYRENDIPGLRDVIHALKGNACYVGAARLVSACDTGEKLCVGHATGQIISDAINSIRDAYYEAVPALNRYAQSPQQRVQ